MFKMPILFLIFNRPNLTEKVFEKISQVKPTKLFIAADGARNEEEYELCKKTRQIVLDGINWDCEVKTLFREKNLGCKVAVSSAIDWFFENEEQGIILEDDCLPHQSFFAYCEELLEYYKNDTRIMHISGNNPLIEYGDNSYFFSKLAHIWGWATWRRAWKYYDVNMNNYGDFLKDHIIKDIWTDENRQTQWLNILQDIYNGKIDTWDYQWMYVVFCQNGLCINPQKNLISNIGFGENATHTLEKNSPRANRPTFNTEKIIHPVFIYGDKSALDKITGSS